jgi:glycosyltransferase involved in cell wall biosynthesis
VPYVFQPHGGLNAYHRNHHSGRKAIYEALFERRNINSAAAIRYDSIAEQHDGIAAGFRAGVVVPPGADMPKSLEYDRRHPGRILFLGRLTKKKGLDILLEAFAIVARDLPQSELQIVGPDDEGIGMRLVARARELDLSTRVHIKGLMVGSEKENLLAEAAVVVLPSADESFGATVIEGMAYGAPVVLTPGVPIHAQVAASQAGIVVERAPLPLADGLRAILANPDGATTMGRNGRALVEREYSWHVVAERLERVYLEIVAARRSGAERVRLSSDVQQEAGGA